MKASEMLKMWLRDRAKALRAVAEQTSSAYGSGPMAEVCARIAKVHMRAAKLYERELAIVDEEEAEVARREANP